MTDENESLRRRVAELEAELVSAAQQLAGQRETEQRLRASEEAFRHFFDNAPIGKSMTAPDGRLLRVNAAFAAMLGRSVEELQAGTYAVLTHPDDLAESKECIRALVAGERDTWQMEKRYVHADGHHVWALVTTRLQRDAAGVPAHFLSHVLDITEQKRVRLALRESEERYCTTLASIGDAVLSTDGAGRVALMNPVAEALTGWLSRDACGRPLDEVFRIVNEETRATVDSPVARVLREGQVVGLANHTLLLARDGTLRPIADSGAPIRDEAGETIGVVLVFRDQSAERLQERLLHARLQIVEHASDHSLAECLTFALDTMSRLVDSPIGFFHFVERDGRTIELQQWSTRTRAEFCTAEGAGQHYDLDAAGVWADCVRERRPVVHNDYASLPHRKGLPPGHAQVVRELAVPVIRGGRVVAAVGVGNKPVDYTDGDVATLSTLADVAWEVARRKRAEEAFHREAARAHLYLETAGVMMLALDAEARVAMVNAQGCALLGVPREEILGQPWVDRFIPPAWQAAIRDKFARVVAGQDDLDAQQENPVLTRDGNERLVSWKNVVLRGERGEVVGTLSSGVDVTERREAERALAAERENLRALLDAAPAAIFVVDENGELLSVNAEAARLLGQCALDSGDPQRCGDLMRCLHRREDPRGCGFSPSCPSCPVNLAVRRALAGEPTRHQEALLELEADGVRQPRSFVFGAARVAVNGGIGAAVALQDVTALREAQADRERLQASLAQSDRLASMGMLAAGVAHEINNPLSYVLYNVESVAEDLPRIVEAMRRSQATLARIVGPEAAALATGSEPDAVGLAAMDDVVGRLQEAVSGAQRIKQITRGLGTFSRVERDEVTSVRLQPVIEQALSMAFNQIKYRARVVKDFSEIPPVLASDGKLAQVFLNLFVNAAHAIDEGHVESNEIRVRTWAEGDSVLAEVSDTGRGIPPEHLGRIFEPFFTTKEIGVGSGLGLSIAKNIVTGFGGEISFTSEPGKGTRFLVRLPRLPRDWATAEAPGLYAPRARSPVRGRILVVDDEEGIRAALARVLGREHDVVTAASGEEAQLILEKDQRFDLVYCDLMMPRVSGMELHAWLASHDAGLAEQVVFITGGAFTPGASEYLARVGNLCIDKPFDGATLKRMTSELVLAARSKPRD